MIRLYALACAMLAFFALPTLAQEPLVKITAEIATVTVQTPNGPVEIGREQNPDARLEGDWARVARDCPPFCIQPMTPAPGVTTIGELELLELLTDPAAMVIDSRTRDWFEGGTIPGSVNIPYNEIGDRLAELGCEADFDGWDCSNARKVALFCNGLWCGQSPSAIRVMLSLGYPADKIHYYRGGMQVWRLLGLTVVQP
ncbi:rhodanese-related sulfurtransferase [Albidovulum inexpectatum]|uniref:Rhodanese-related sulfurtransferase n=1 Tax=Albidovulum inexpectatum TaxID=196587 RepID=A0A2S5JG92_9RHOB|nr:rhodanese-like domain-containing protein [Albidovulum inexpectatum]PPB80439.1 rhodanese-related sulfurtransferase [Albidovulum inexpectatum]